jgi:hypothetical protein
VKRILAIDTRRRIECAVLARVDALFVDQLLPVRTRRALGRIYGPILTRIDTLFVDEFLPFWAGRAIGVVDGPILAQRTALPFQELEPLGTRGAVGKNGSVSAPCYADTVEPRLIFGALVAVGRIERSIFATLWTVTGVARLVLLARLARRAAIDARFVPIPLSVFARGGSDVTFLAMTAVTGAATCNDLK